MISLAVASLVLVKATPTLAPGQITLRFHPPVGTKYKYTMKMDMAMAMGAKVPPMGMTTTVDMEMTVLSSSGGVTTMETKGSNAHVTLPANSPMASMKATMEKQMAAKPAKMKIDTLYHVSGVTGTGADSALSNMQNLNFPVKAVRVGDTWGTTLDVGKFLGGMMGGKTPGMNMSGSIPIQFKLLEIGRGPKGQTATISIAMKGSMSMSMQGQAIPITMNASGTYKVDVATGMTVGMKMKSATTSSFGGNSMVQNMTQSMTLH